MENISKTTPINISNYPEYPKTYHIAYGGVREAKEFAFLAHSQTNHLYDGYLPYGFHLTLAEGNFIRFKHLVHEYWNRIVNSAIFLHDTIEDTRTTYSDIKQQFGEDVADIVYAVTNEKGKNRKDRENDKYFEGIRNTPYATFVKLCDRIANVEYSKSISWKDKSKLEMYRKEHGRFKEQLYEEKYKEMFDYLDGLFA